MVQTFGDLMVRLGLESSSFQKGIADVSRQIRLSNSEFQAYGKAAVAVGDNLDIVKVRANTLATSIDLNNKKIESYQNTINNSSKRLETLAGKHGELAKEVDKSKLAYEESAKSKGKDAEETLQLKEQYEKLRVELAQNEEMQKRAVRSIENNTIQANRTKGIVADLTAELEQTSATISKLESNLWKAGAKLEEWGESAQIAGRKWQEVGQSVQGVGKTLSVAVTAPIVAMGAGAIKSAMDFETAFTGVIKTVDMTAQETENMRQQIMSLTEELPHAKESIAEVAKSAGQLGIQKANIMDFTETMLNMGVATDMSADTAATAMARFANITKMSQDDFNRLGSVIVGLGNNFATTESEITEMGLRLAGAGDQIGLTEAEILGFAAALSSVGIQAEAGGSAFSKAMIDMQVAIETGSEKVNAFAEVAGMSGEAFAKAFKEDAAGAIGAFIQGLGDTENAGKSTILMLDEMGFKEVRLRDSFTRLAGNSQLVSNALETSSKAWKENNALTKEAELFNATAANQLQVMKNRIGNIATEIGEDLTPALLNLGNNAVDKVTTKWRGMTKEQKANLVQMAATAAATGPVVLAMGKLTSGIGSTITSIGKFSSYLGETAKAMSGVDGASTLLAKGLTGLTSPAGIAVLAISGLTAAYALATKESREYQKALNEARDTTEELSGLYDRTTLDFAGHSQRVHEANQATLKSFQEMSIAAINSLGELKIGAEMVSADTVDAVIAQYENLGDQMKATIDTRTNEAIQVYSEILSRASGITEEEEAAILEAMRTNGVEQKSTIDDTFNTIKGYIATSMAESGEITEQTMLQITEAINIMNATVEQTLGGDGWTKALEYQVKSGLIPLTKEGFEQLSETVESEYKAQEKAALESFSTTIDLANSQAEAGSEAHKKLTEVAKLELDRQILDLEVHKVKRLNIMYELNKEEVDALVERNAEIEENESKLSLLEQERTAAKLSLNATYYIELTKQMSELKEKNNELKLTPEEVEELSLFKVLYDNNLISQDLINQQIDAFTIKIQETAGVTATEAKAIADGIVNGFATLPEELTNKGQEAALSLAQSLAENGAITQVEAETLKNKIILELDGLKTDAGVLTKEAIEAMAKSLSDSQNIPVGEAEKLVRATADPFNALPDLLDGKTAEAANAIVKQLESKNLITKEKAVYLGEMLDKGLVEGIYNSKAEVEKAVTDVSESMISTSEKTLEMNSPSKKAIVIGEQFGEGLKLGIEAKQSDIERIARESARLALEQIESYTQPFYQAGFDLGQGAADGLQSATRLLINEARSMARAAMDAMRSELDIHSPSRVARKIFQQVGEGAVLGLQDEQAILRRASSLFANASIAELKQPPTQKTPVPISRAGVAASNGFNIEKIEVHITTQDASNPREAERFGRQIADSLHRNMRLKGVLG